MEQIYHIRLNYDLFSFGIKNDIMRCNCHIDKEWTCDDWPNLLTWLAMESTKRQDTGKTCKISSQLSYWKWETCSKCRGIMLMTAQTEGHRKWRCCSCLLGFTFSGLFIYCVAVTAPVAVFLHWNQNQASLDLQHGLKTSSSSWILQAFISN